MINPYYLFMGEASGYLNTRESKIQKTIKDIKNDPREVVDLAEVLVKNGIDPKSITPKELDRIQRAIKWLEK